MKQPEKPEKWGKARPWILISAPAILKNKYFYFVAALFILALSIASGNGSMTVYYCGNILIDILIHQNGNIVIQTLQFKLKNGVNANDLIRACFQTGMLDLTSVATLV